MSHGASLALLDLTVGFSSTILIYEDPGTRGFLWTIVSQRVPIAGRADSHHSRPDPVGSSGHHGWLCARSIELPLAGWGGGQAEEEGWKDEDGEKLHPRAVQVVKWFGQNYWVWSIIKSPERLWLLNPWGMLPTGRRPSLLQQQHYLYLLVQKDGLQVAHQQRYLTVESNNNRRLHRRLQLKHWYLQQKPQTWNPHQNQGNRDFVIRNWPSGKVKSRQTVPWKLPALIWNFLFLRGLERNLKRL